MLLLPDEVDHLFLCNNRLSWIDSIRGTCVPTGTLSFEAARASSEGVAHYYLGCFAGTSAGKASKYCI